MTRCYAQSGAPAQAVAEQYRGGQVPLRPTATSHPSILNALLLLPAASIVAFIVSDFLEKSSVIFFFSAQFRNFLKASANGIVIGRPMGEQAGGAVLVALLRVGEIAAALVA
jgi:hypothetical protein